MTTVAFVLNRPLNTGGQAIVCVLRPCGCLWK